MPWHRLANVQVYFCYGDLSVYGFYGVPQSQRSAFIIFTIVTVISIIFKNFIIIVQVGVWSSPTINVLLFLNFNAAPIFLQKLDSYVNCVSQFSIHCRLDCPGLLGNVYNFQSEGFCNSQFSYVNLVKLQLFLLLNFQCLLGL